MMSKFLNLLKKYKLLLRYNFKVKKILKSKKYTLDKTKKKEIIQFYKSYGFIKINTSWHKAYYGLNNKYSIKYIPENIFYYTILPKLGYLNLSAAYSDKNIYDNLFKHYNKPKTIIKNIKGNFYDAQFNNISFDEAKKLMENSVGNFIMKPSLNTQQGINVHILSIDQSGNVYLNNNLIDSSQALKLISEDFIIQEKVLQNQLIQNIYSHSLNTFRIMTLKLNDKVHFLSAVLRLGVSGNHVDNYTQGGIAVGINKYGELNSFGMNKDFNKFFSHPDTKTEFKNIKIPNFYEAIVMVQSMHKSLYYHDLASWDIALDENGAFVFIEVNLGGQEINFHQANNGPLFGEFTDSILKKYKINKK